MTQPPHLVLASASPARRKTLAAAGIDVEVIVSGVDESTVDLTDPAAFCLALAAMKAAAVAERLRGRPVRPGSPVLVLGCDSILAFDGQILGKPADRDEAVARWRQMRGRSGELFTGHSLIDLTGDRHADATAVSTVHFADISDAEIEAYVNTGEPLEVAGAFTIDGLGGPFVESIVGDPGTVVGVSLPLLRRLLATLDVPITQLWRP
ncbi:Maf family protein [Rugosimonospora africana]|uniref:Nucleoside triphosphate pyrophosphatase n=1 Tax=Rugosimonospora africana TaxID=556532 RepID=A0A8J3QL81_9ACTN|nr:nucleoside triphosphate pyrophosphatase [Rugosimonospora africana]GIH12646.1 Maf-like protein [Rugosimonospora africana]